MNFGKFLREHRKMMGLSQKELAKRMGVSKSWVSQYEVGTHINPNIVYVDLACKSLNATYTIGPVSVNKKVDDVPFMDIVFQRWSEFDSKSKKPEGLDISCSAFYYWFNTKHSRYISLKYAERFCDFYKISYTFGSGCNAA